MSEINVGCERDCANNSGGECSCYMGITIDMDGMCEDYQPSETG